MGRTCADIKGEKHETLHWERDPHRAMICDMKGPIEDAVNERYGSSGTAQKEERKMFYRLVKEEEDKARRANEYQKKPARRPYKARVALGLIALLASVLG